MSRSLVITCDSAEGCCYEDGRPKREPNNLEIELPDGGFSAETDWLSLFQLEDWVIDRIAASGWIEDRHGDATCPDCTTRRAVDEELRRLPEGAFRERG